MVHSTGSNNPNVRRYIPGNEVTGSNTGNNHWDRPGLEKCVHAFIGRFADGSVGTVQTLPWNFRGWHAGRGELGSANDTHISFEICEDGLTDPQYFAQIYQQAAALTAYLCRRFHLDPLSPGTVLCHAEGHRRGIASDHVDVLHWFPRHGKTMDDFRRDVAEKMGGGEEMTQEAFDRMLEDWLARKGQEGVSPWAREGLAQAVEQGFTDGTRPQAFATRQEVALMIRAAAER